MYFACVGFDFDGIFKQDTYTVGFHGYELELTKEKVESRDTHFRPAVLSNQIHIKVNPKDADAAHEAALLFLSELSWLWDVSILATELGSGSCPIRFNTSLVGHRGGRNVIDMDYYKQMPLDDEQRLAIGLYKEGISSNSIFLGYLGFFKILEIRMNRDERQEWLTKFLTDNWRGFDFEKRYEYVPKDPAELQIFLYKYGRCAVAHANTNPRIDAHCLNDYRTMGVCYDVIKDAVRSYMNKKMNIPRLLHYS